MSNECSIFVNDKNTLDTNKCSCYIYIVEGSDNYDKIMGWFERGDFIILIISVNTCYDELQRKKV